MVKHYVIKTYRRGEMQLRSLFDLSFTPSLHCPPCGTKLDRERWQHVKLFVWLRFGSSGGLM